jgi:putative polyhydroxyalkanoate system protein
MPKFTITRNHSLSPAVLKDRINELGEKLKAKYSATATWNGDKEMKVKGTGVEAKVTLASDKVDVFVDLPMMLSMMKGKIEEAISAELDKVVQPESAS